MGTLFGREPAMFLAVLQAVLGAVIVFGFDLSGDQAVTIMAVAATVLGLVTRSQVSPVNEV